MKLTQLKLAVDNAIEHANECHESPEGIRVSLQIYRDGNAEIWGHENLELTYDNNTNASGCVLSVVAEESDTAACSGVDVIAKERQRQIEKERYFHCHDDQFNKSGELCDAAQAYVYAAGDQARGNSLDYLKSLVPAAAVRWPWEEKHWKPSDDPIRNLAKAGALIAAEIDRLQRL